MDIKSEVLLGFYKENRTLARHHSEQTGKITQFILLMSAGVLGIAKFGETPPVVGYILGSFIILLGVIGAILTRTQSNNCSDQSSCASAYRQELEELQDISHTPPGDDHKGQWAWLPMHILVIILGIVVILCFKLSWH